MYDKPNKYFSVKEQQIFICPTCHKGHLKFKKVKDSKELLSSSALSKNDDYPYDEGIFSIILICNYNKCQESVSFCGEYYLESDFYLQEEVLKFKPTFFYPALHLFKIPEKCPKIVKKAIIKSFAHYFNDYGACANSIRIAIEYLLDEQGIDREYVTNNNKRKDAKLHYRIKNLNISGNTEHPNFISFWNNKPNLADLLMSIKFMSNDGSHLLDGIKDQNDLFDAYTLLEEVLNDLYVDKEQKIIDAKNNLDSKYLS